jgi:lysozyme family protein
MTVRDQVAWIVVAYEGGDSDHPSDRGGLTRFGLTLTTFLEERPKGTLEEFLALTREDVIDLLTEKHALRPGYFRIQDDALRLAVIDYAIHSGPRRATTALQKAAGVHVDGLFGRHTEEAVNRLDASMLRRRVLGHRLRHLGRLITNDRSQAVFAAGWMNRLASQIEAA